MKAVLTSKGQITIPAPIRERLGLKTGHVLDFDENAPFLKAVLAFDEDEMRSVLGCARDALGRSSSEWLDETRGCVAGRAQTQADRLAAVDRGYLRRYFSRLPLVQP
jgi:AbrB family looped-hinge helix DNA binding protein